MESTDTSKSRKFNFKGKLMWGLAAFGQAGVEMVLKILRAELKDVMMFTGTRSIKEISQSYVGKT